MPERNASWSFARMRLITLGVRMRAKFRLRDTGEVVTVRDLAPSDEGLVRAANGEWVGILVQGPSGERWVSESDLLPLESRAE